jgi:hypothetical protein
MGLLIPFTFTVTPGTHLRVFPLVDSGVTIGEHLAHVLEAQVSEHRVEGSSEAAGGTGTSLSSYVVGIKKLLIPAVGG